MLLAAIVQLFRPPEIPKKPEGLTELPTQINLELEEVSMAPPGGRALRYTEEQVNAYVANRLKSKRKTLSSYLQFEGATVALEEGFARGTVERSLFGFSVYTSATFSPRVEGGTVVPHVLGGKIGRMPIHPALMKYSGFVFTDAVAVFDREIKSIARLGGIELHPKLVVINPKPGAAVPVPRQTHRFPRRPRPRRCRPHLRRPHRPLSLRRIVRRRPGAVNESPWPTAGRSRFGHPRAILWRVRSCRIALRVPLPAIPSIAPR